MKETIYFEAKAKKSKTPIEKTIKELGIVYPNDSLGFLHAKYAKLEEANKNKVMLAESVQDDISKLRFTQCNFSHKRSWNVCGSILAAWLNEDTNEIEIVFSFFKSLYPKEWEEAQKLLEKDKLTVSFELKVSKADITVLENGVRKLSHCDFDGVGLLMGESPAYPGAFVLEMAKQKVAEIIGQDCEELVYAKAMAEDCRSILKSIETAIESKSEEFAKKWTTKYINTLPNSSFAVIEPAYLDGKIEDKNARHLPFKNENGEVDLAHYRNALARVNQIEPITDSISKEELIKKAKAKLEKYRHLLNTEKASEEENIVDKKTNDALLAEQKRIVIAEFGDNVVKEWKDEDFLNDDKITALRNSLNIETPSSEPEKPAEEPNIEVKAEDTKIEEIKTEEAQQRVVETETTQKVIDVMDNETMEEKIIIETESIRKVDNQIKETVKTKEERIYNFAEVEAIKAEYEAKIVSKDAEIIFLKENAKKIVEIRAELGTFVATLSDEELFDAIKIENARLKKENADLKSGTRLETAEEIKVEETVDNKNLTTGHTEETVKEDTKADKDLRLAELIKKRYTGINK